jgi:hypothetical protein
MSKVPQRSPHWGPLIFLSCAPATTQPQTGHGTKDSEEKWEGDQWNQGLGNIPFPPKIKIIRDIPSYSPVLLCRLWLTKGQGGMEGEGATKQHQLKSKTHSQNEGGMI